jgi:hypothetical protein
MPLLRMRGAASGDDDLLVPGGALEGGAGSHAPPTGQEGDLDGARGSQRIASLFDDGIVMGVGWREAWIGFLVTVGRNSSS